MLREILEELLNKYRVVKTDEDLEWNRAVDMCRNIIEKHINDGKGTNVPTKDGWISVEERLPKEHLTMLKNCPFLGGKSSCTYQRRGKGCVQRVRRNVEVLS